MSRTKPGNKVELKYCEGCGCLLTRTIGSGLTFCSECEINHSEEHIHLIHPKYRSNRPRRMLKGADLQSSWAHPKEVRGNTDLQGLDLQGLDLEDLDLEGLDLEGLDLEGLDLEGLDLEGFADEGVCPDAYPGACSDEEVCA